MHLFPPTVTKQFPLWINKAYPSLSLRLGDKKETPGKLVKVVPLIFTMLIKTLTVCDIKHPSSSCVSLV